MNRHFGATHHIQPSNIHDTTGITPSIQRSRSCFENSAFWQCLDNRIGRKRVPSAKFFDIRPGTADPARYYNTLHCPSRLSGMMDGRSRIATIRIGNDAEDPTPAVKFNLEDHLRTSSVVLDQYGGLINREEYYPFGDTCFGAFAKKRYRYVGREKDSESGLYYYGARYYSSWTCRFVSVDPLAPKYPQLTPYNYAANDPIGDLDIDGMQNTKTPEGGGSGGSSAKQVPDQGGLPTFELGEVEVIGIKPPSAGPRIEASPTAAVAPLVLAAAVAEPLEAAVGTSVVEGYTYSEMLQSAGVAESPSGGGPNWLLRVGFTVGAILMPAGGTGAGSVPLQRPFRSEPNYDLMDTEHDPKSEFAYQDLEPSIAQPATESTSTPLTRYGESTATATEERFRFYATYTKTGVRSDGTTITYSGRTSGWTTNSTGPTREEAERAVALRDFGHHMTALGFGRAVLDKASLSRAAIRGREQQLIDHFGGAWKSDNGTSGNAIRAVSKYNLAGPAYHMAANALFGELHKYTGYRLFP